MLSRIPTRCVHCRTKFSAEEKARGLRLHTECIAPWLVHLTAKKQAARLKQERARAKVERAVFKKRKEALVRLSDLEEQCRKIVQKIARIRDRNDGCISCEKPASWDGQWHGSHFRPAGNNAAVQFHLWNIHKACWIDNKLHSGKLGDYEPKLVAKIGQAKVDWLKSQTQVVKYSREYLYRFKAVMSKKLRRMEKRIAQSC